MFIIINISSDDGLISTCTKSDSGIVRSLKPQGNGKSRAIRDKVDAPFVYQLGWNRGQTLVPRQ